jgi:predicted ribonuclease YlaK
MVDGISQEEYESFFNEEEEQEEELSTARMLVDTCALLSHLDTIEELQRSGFEIVINYETVRELDKAKERGDAELKYQARKASRFLMEFHSMGGQFISDKPAREYLVDIGEDELYNDTYLIAHCILDDSLGIITSDNNVFLRGDANGVVVLHVGMDEGQASNRDFKGYHLLPSNYSQDIYNQEEVPLDAKEGDYLECKNEVFVRKDDMWESVNKKGFKTKLYGRITPKDNYQAMAIDSILRNQFTIITGKTGSGKSFLGLAGAMKLLETGLIDKLYVAIGASDIKDTKQFGFVPGTIEEKMLNESVGGVLFDKIGEEFVYELMNDGKLKLVPFNKLRGRSFGSGEEHCAVYMSEVQNLSVYQMKDLVTRAGENCRYILDGDVGQQDERTFGGINWAIEKYRGSGLFGTVQLPNTHRSRMAEIASED